MIVEDVAVRQQARGPGPGDVQMLRLVGVEAIAEEGGNPQQCATTNQDRQGQPLAARSLPHAEGGAP